MTDDVTDEQLAQIEADMTIRERSLDAPASSRLWLLLPDSRETKQ